MTLNRNILEERELLDLETIKNRKINSTLASGLFLGTILSTLPQMVMPLEAVNRKGVYTHSQKDSNVWLYSIFLGYVGTVIPFIYTERSRRGDSLCSEIQRYYMKEDGLL